MGKIRMAMVDAGTGEVYYFLNDRLGSPRIMTDDEGNVVWEALYKPFGEVEVNTKSSVENNFRFPGQYFDEETGLHYNYHRYYEPGMGRYLRADPIGLFGGLNLFVYVENNPVNILDSDGLQGLTTIRRVLTGVVTRVLGINPGSIFKGEFGGKTLLRGEQGVLLRSALDSNPRFQKMYTSSVPIYFDHYTQAIIRVRDDDKVLVYSQFSQQLVEMSAETYRERLYREQLELPLEPDLQKEDGCEK